MKENTKIIHTGLNDRTAQSTVNIPVHRSSTIVYPDLVSYLQRFDNQQHYEKVTYGATGSKNSYALAEAVAAIEGANHTTVTSTGLSACTLTLGALVRQGDHILVADSVYQPSRHFCSHVLSRYGVETEFFDPTLGAEIKSLCRPNTRLVFAESPGSLTFEMQDIPALVKAAHTCNVLVAMDNSWATPVYFKPLDHGVDISIQAGTKYVSGHSDLVIGFISTTNRELHIRIAGHAMTLGDIASPDDCYLALRGLRTMALRVPRHFESALIVANWLEKQPQVKRIFYPPLQSDPNHSLWKRDFGGGAGLFSVILNTNNLDAISRMVNNLELFRIGSSWGGYESLVSAYVSPIRRDSRFWNETSTLLRFHIGLEAPSDLIADIKAGLERL